jgi:proline iminopeptidase
MVSNRWIGKSNTASYNSRRAGHAGLLSQSSGKLADERPVIFYHQLGCGKSDRPKDPSLWRIDRFLEELAAVRKTLGLREVHVLAHSWGTMLMMDYWKTKPQGIRSMILSGAAISVKKWIEDANRYGKQLPPEVQATLKKHEETGTTDSQEYQEAVMVYYQKHVCRLKPWPPEVESTLKEIGMEEYLTMWGPSEFYATGNLKEFDGTAQLERITFRFFLFQGGLMKPHLRLRLIITICSPDLPW